MPKYCAEYDENSMVWLINLETKARVCLEHGDVLDIRRITSPRVSDPPTPVSAADPRSSHI
jgi:hypothetical protein